MRGRGARAQHSEIAETQFAFASLGALSPTLSRKREREFRFERAASAQTTEKIRPTSQLAMAQPAPVKKPTQNQTPI